MARILMKIHTVIVEDHNSIEPDNLKVFADESESDLFFAVQRYLYDELMKRYMDIEEDDLEVLTQQKVDWNVLDVEDFDVFHQIVECYMDMPQTEVQDNDNLLWRSFDEIQQYWLRNTSENVPAGILRHETSLLNRALALEDVGLMRVKKKDISAGDYYYSVYATPEGRKLAFGTGAKK